MNVVLLLLADDNRFQSMGRQFRRGGSTLDLGQLLIWVTVLVLLVAAASLISNRMARRQKPGYRSSRRLFHDLCRAHGLDQKKRMLLRQMARYQRLQQPARLFLEPERFDAANLGSVLAARRGEIQRMRDIVFGKRLKIQE